MRDIFTAHMHNKKTAEELLAATRSPQDAHEYEIRREKSIKRSRTMKTNTFGGQITTTTKQEPRHYINPRGRNNYTNSQISQRGGGGFRGRPYNRGTQKTRGQQSRTTSYNTQKQCYKCSNQFGQNHLQSCPAKDKICSKCAKRGHFAKVCLQT